MFVENEAEESSRPLKDPSVEERDHLRQTAKASVAHFSDGFFKHAGTSASAHTPTPKKRKVDGDAGEDEEDEDTGGGSKSGQKSEVMDEAPKQFGKLNKELPTVQKVMREAVRKLVDNLKTTAEQSDKEDPELQSYRRTAAFRLRLGKVWMSTTVEGAKEFIALSTPALLIKCGVVETRLEDRRRGRARLEERRRCRSQ